MHRAVVGMDKLLNNRLYLWVAVLLLLVGYWGLVSLVM